MNRSNVVLRVLCSVPSRSVCKNVARRCKVGKRASAWLGAILALGALALLPIQQASASIYEIDSYVLFAKESLSFKGGNSAGTGYVLGGNVGVNEVLAGVSETNGLFS